jgi:hypothetical protein
MADITEEGVSCKLAYAFFFAANLLFAKANISYFVASSKVGEVWATYFNTPHLHLGYFRPYMWDRCRSQLFY